MGRVEGALETVCVCGRALALDDLIFILYGRMQGRKEGRCHYQDIKS